MLRLFGEYQDCAVGTSCPIDMGIFQYLYIVDVVNRDVVDRLCLYAVYDIKGCGVAVDAFCSTDIHLAVAAWIAVVGYVESWYAASQCLKDVAAAATAYSLS